MEGEEPGGRSMVDLSRSSGLPLWLDVREQDLFLAQPLQRLEPEPQPHRLLGRQLLEPDAPAPEVAYWLFPDVALPTDEGVYREFGMRHNLLLVRPGRAGPEYAKTRGHVLVRADGSLSPVAYGVVAGRALFLLQEPPGAPPRDVRCVAACPGQKVLVPPGCGVVVVNPGPEAVVLSNLRPAEAWPDHGLYERLQGAAYYVVGPEGGVDTRPNRHYGAPLPPLRAELPVQAPELGVTQQIPLYSAFVHQPQQFNWLRQAARAAAGAR